MIEIEGLSFSRAGAPILANIDLTIEAGGITALIGPNGAGKSTLLSLVARLLKPTAGHIRVDGLDVATTPTATLAKRVAIMAQEAAVTSRLRVRELVAFGRFPHHRGRPAPQDHAATREALALFELEDLAERFLDTLSGGQRQRARAAMAFCQGTDYLLLDEPLNSLDIRHARQLMTTLRRVADERERTVLVVLHDLNYAASHADHIVALRDGTVLAHGPTEAVMSPQVLADVFGYDIPVLSMDGRPVALHFR